MKPKKAIEVLGDLGQSVTAGVDEEEKEAIQLGIEALDFFIEFQRVTGSHQDARLPSETKD